MKKLLFLSFGVAVLFGCNNPKTTSPEEMEEPVVEQKSVGGDVDEYGCLTGAGETWSELRQKCIQVFNVGERLNPVEQNKDEAVFSAFVIFDEDQSKAEVFLPKSEGTYVLVKTEEAVYEAFSYRYDAAKKELFHEGELKYKAE